MQWFLAANLFAEVPWDVLVLDHVLDLALHGDEEQHHPVEQQDGPEDGDVKDREKRAAERDDDGFAAGVPAGSTTSRRCSVSGSVAVIFDCNWGDMTARFGKRHHCRPISARCGTMRGMVVKQLEREQKKQASQVSRHAEDETGKTAAMCAQCHIAGYQA